MIVMKISEKYWEKDELKKPTPLVEKVERDIENGIIPERSTVTSIHSNKMMSQLSLPFLQALSNVFLHKTRYWIFGVKEEDGPYFVAKISNMATDSDRIAFLGIDNKNSWKGGCISKSTGKITPTVWTNFSIVDFLEVLLLAEINKMKKDKELEMNLGLCEYAIKTDSQLNQEMVTSLFKMSDSFACRLKKGELANDVPDCLSVDRKEKWLEDFRIYLGINETEEKATSSASSAPIEEYTPRKLTPDEQALVDLNRERLEKNGVILSKEAKTIVTCFKQSRSKNLSAQNFLLYGPAGTGKSTSAAMIANELGLPLVRMSLGPDSDKFDLLCSTQPNVDKNSKEENDFVFVNSPIIEAAEKGWVCEVQEPTLVLNPGLLGMLNSLLEEGTVTLPSGRTIVRHPDNVIVFTTNVSYEGCNKLNAALKDRCRKVIEVNLPTNAVLLKRVKARSGNEDEEQLKKMLKVFRTMQKYCAEHLITDGEISERSLINWAADSLVEDPYEACIEDVINKASFDEEEQRGLMEILDNSEFK